MKRPNYVSVAVVALCANLASAAPQPHRFADLEGYPAPKREVLEFFAAQKEGLCLETTRQDMTSPVFQECMHQAERVEAYCIKSISVEMPNVIRSEADFKQFGLRLMRCLVPEEGGLTNG